MASQIEPESEAHRLFRKLTDLKMRVGETYIRQDGKQVMTVNGYVLTVEQLRELERRNELSSWGIREFAERLSSQR
jgi:hypothetical protein